LEDLSAYQKIKYYIKIYLNSQCYGISGLRENLRWFFS